MKYPTLLSVPLLLLCLPPAWMLAAAADMPPVHSKPAAGCQTKCGNVDIPYPFGIGDQCAIHNDFNITCRPVDGTMTPFWGDFELTKISVPDAKAWMKMNIYWRCYGAEISNMQESTLSQNFTGTPFTFSRVDNKIFVMGCNTVGYMTTSSVSTSSRYVSFNSHI
jgi:hypothetical protein